MPEVNPTIHRVIVGLSGGVDSSVAALRLKAQGYAVEGLFMKNWEEDSNSQHCPYESDLKDVISICKTLDIKLHTVNFAQEYWQDVFSHFLDEYAAGRTPNPDILCNKEIKFKAFLDHALKLGADAIATGHYARIQNTEPRQLLKAVDLNKDQSYFLYTLNQHALKHALFPLGDLTKPEVRAIAKAHGLVNYDKKDSTGICFIGERPFNDFISEYLPSTSGDIKTPEGQVVGQHPGLLYYTLGQRHGIGIGGQKNAAPAPWYVVGKDMEKNVLYVTQDVNHPWHFTKTFKATQCHWVSGNAPNETIRCQAKIRYRQKDVACVLTPTSPNTADITFIEPQKSVTPGQSVVLYDQDICLGGGIIHMTDSPCTLRYHQKETLSC